MLRKSIEEREKSPRDVLRATLIFRAEPFSSFYSTKYGEKGEKGSFEKQRLRNRYEINAA